MGHSKHPHHKNQSIETKYLKYLNNTEKNRILMLKNNHLELEKDF